MGPEVGVFLFFNSHNIYYVKLNKRINEPRIHTYRFETKFVHPIAPLSNSIIPVHEYRNAFKQPYARIFSQT